MDWKLFFEDGTGVAKKLVVEYDTSWAEYCRIVQKDLHNILIKGSPGAISGVVSLPQLTVNTPLIYLSFPWLPLITDREADWPLRGNRKGIVWWKVQLQLCGHSARFPMQTPCTDCQEMMDSQDPIQDGTSLEAQRLTAALKSSVTVNRTKAE